MGNPTKPATVKYLRIETASASTRVEAGGAMWAGISEVPADSLSATQLAALRAHPELKVSDAEPRAAD